jgi:hypothetical protein
MALSGDLFQASTRLAMTENFRGMPSSGRAWSVATRTDCPPATDYRRAGSSHTASPAANGTTVMMPPSTFAASFLKKPRRSEQHGTWVIFCMMFVDESAGTTLQNAKGFAWRRGNPRGNNSSDPLNPGNRSHLALECAKNFLRDFALIETYVLAP